MIEQQRHDYFGKIRTLQETIDHYNSTPLEDRLREALAIKKEKAETLVLVDVLLDEQTFMKKWGYK